MMDIKIFHEMIYDKDSYLDQEIANDVLTVSILKQHKSHVNKIKYSYNFIYFIYFSYNSLQTYCYPFPSLQ